MFWVVNHGIRYLGMGAWNGEMPDDKIWSVATFLSHLKPCHGMCRPNGVVLAEQLESRTSRNETEDLF
jgi:hypothetical protein